MTTIPAVPLRLWQHDVLESTRMEKIFFQCFLLNLFYLLVISIVCPRSVWQLPTLCHNSGSLPNVCGLLSQTLSMASGIASSQKITPWLLFIVPHHWAMPAQVFTQHTDVGRTQQDGGFVIPQTLRCPFSHDCLSCRRGPKRPALQMERIPLSPFSTRMMSPREKNAVSSKKSLSWFSGCIIGVCRFVFTGYGG